MNQNKYLLLLYSNKCKWYTPHPIINVPAELRRGYRPAQSMNGPRARGHAASRGRRVEGILLLLPSYRVEEDQQEEMDLPT